MTLDEARQSIGAGVVYTAYHGAKEDGTITEVREYYVMVRYVGDRHAKATLPDDLELLRPVTP